MTLQSTLFSKSRRLTVGLIALSAIATLTACKTQPTNASETTPTNTEIPTDIEISTDLETVEDVSEPATTNKILVSETGFGNATLCTTPEELQAALPNFVVGSPGNGPLVDTQGVEITDADGNLAFYALSVVGGDRLNLFVTDNPAYQTAEGIGPGTLVETAVETYGTAELSYHSEAESREFVSFENGPAQAIAFRTGSGDEAGIYEGEGDYQTTAEYRPEATIKSIWVNDRSCL
ncbi:MAG: hypothetical protein AAFN40_14920 [Cyanobacteria bacterium J06560_6]